MHTRRGDRQHRHLRCRVETDASVSKPGRLTSARDDKRERRRPDPRRLHFVLNGRLGRPSREARSWREADSRKPARGRASPNDQWSVHRRGPRVGALALASSLVGRHLKDFSAPRFRRSAHRAPAGDARCDRGPPPAPHDVRAARDRAAAPSGGAERHAAIAAASPADRRRARDGAEARGMDALALVMSDKARRHRRGVRDRLPTTAARQRGWLSDRALARSADHSHENGAGAEAALRERRAEVHGVAVTCAGPILLACASLP